MLYIGCYDFSILGLKLTHISNWAPTQFATYVTLMTPIKMKDFILLCQSSHATIADWMVSSIIGIESKFVLMLHGENIVNSLISDYKFGINTLILDKNYIFLMTYSTIASFGSNEQNLLFPIYHKGPIDKRPQLVQIMAWCLKHIAIIGTSVDQYP